MIHRPRSNPSLNFVEHSLIKFEQQRAQEYFSSIQDKPRSLFGFRSYREIPGFLDLLSREFSNKCAYCEQLLAASSDWEISLFRPNQLECIQQEETEYSHYWWLNWDWFNLLLSCHQCNWNKAASFPITGLRAKVGEQGMMLQKENSLLLDPSLDFPDHHLLFMDNGEVMPANDSLRGSTTIEVLDLNRAELVLARSMEARKLYTIIDLTHQRDYSKLFSIESREDKPFSGLRKQLLSRALGMTSSVSKSQIVSDCSDTRIYLAKSTTLLHTESLMQNIAVLNQDGLIDSVLEKRWRIEKQIGAGGMGKIYLARDIRLSMRKVVVKIPDIELIRLPVVRTLFEKEVDILIGHPHPSIVKVEDRGDVNGMPFVVLQHLEGGNLKDLIAKEKGEMSIQKIFQWLFPVARALDFLHQENTLHCDVKPGNILFDRCGHTFLADFGIAKVLGKKAPRKNQSIIFSGTEKYMAPDTDLTPAYDQYSLALVVLEALNGTIPDRKIRIQGITRDFIPNCSSRVRNVLLRALSPISDNRFESCLDFAHNLKGSKERL